MLLSATATTKERSSEAIIAPVYSLALTAHAYLWDWKTFHVKESMEVLTSLGGPIAKIIILGLLYRWIFSYILGVIGSMRLAHLGWTSEPWQRFKVTDVKVRLIWNVCIIGGGTAGSESASFLGKDDVKPGFFVGDLLASWTKRATCPCVVCLVLKVTQVTLFLRVTAWPFNFGICTALWKLTDSRVFHPYQYDLSDKNSFEKQQYQTTPN